MAIGKVVHIQHALPLTLDEYYRILWMNTMSH